MCPHYATFPNQPAIVTWAAIKHKASLDKDILLHQALHDDFGLRHRTWHRTIEAIRSLSRPVCIVETGTARDNGSTFLFARLIHETGGFVHSVDLDEELVNSVRAIFEEAGASAAIRLYAQDSVLFLEDFKHTIDVLYLDSYDVIWTDPYPSMEHHFKELKAAIPKLGNTSIVVLDDTPLNASFAPYWAREIDIQAISHASPRPGKGTLCIDYLLNTQKEFEVVPLIHEYQAVFMLKRIG